MFKKIKLFTLSLLILAFTGCTTYPCYQPYNSKTESGYKDLEFSKNIYNVSFIGNNYFSKELVENFLLKRCAELTLERGFKYFIILKEDTRLTDSRSWTTSSSTPNFPPVMTPMSIPNGNSQTKLPANFSTFPVFPTSISSNSWTETINKYSDIAIIKLLKDNKKYADAIDANTILNQLIDLPTSLEVTQFFGIEPKFR